MTGSWARACYRLSLLTVATLAMLAVYVLAVGPARRWRRPIQRSWCRLVLRLTGLAVRTFGEPYRQGPVLYVCNHVSYLDIAVLSSLVEAVYVAKREIAGWPLFGIIANVTGTVFVDRTPARAHEQREEIRARLEAGERLILFPEGTSTDGSAVAPFKSSLLDVAMPGSGGEGTVMVQPVSIAYPRYADGRPLTGPLRALYCWYGEATLLPHLLRLAGLRGARVEVRFHPPLRAADFPDRKALARHLYQVVAAGVQAADGDERDALTAARRAGADETARSAPAGR